MHSFLLVCANPADCEYLREISWIYGQTRFIQADPVELCSRHAQINPSMRLQQMFAERSMFIKAHLLVLKDSKRAWFKLAMLIQHLSSPWIPRGLVVLRSVLALFGTDSTHLFVCRSRGSYLPLQIVKDSCRQDSKQIRVDTSSPWSTCICILRPALQAWDCFVTVCHSVIGCLPFFHYVDLL